MEVKNEKKESYICYAYNTFNCPIVPLFISLLLI